LVNARQFDNRDEVVALLEDVDRWKAAHAGRAAAHPIAFSLCIESSLYRQERLERITEVGHHASTSWRTAPKWLTPTLLRALRRSFCQQVGDGAADCNRRHAE